MTTSTSTPVITEDTIRHISEEAKEPAWLLERRLEALRAYNTMAMPDPLEEEWRRTDLSDFDLDGDLRWDGSLAAAFIGDGLPHNVTFTDLSGAAVDHEALVREHLHSLVRPTEWKLGALQAAAWQNGAFLYVPRGVEVEVPLTYEMSGSGSPVAPHLLIVAEEGSSVTVLQNAYSADITSQCLVTGAVEIIAKQDARVHFVELQTWGKNVYAFSTVRARLERGAQLTAGLIGLGGRLTKTRLEVELAGEGASAELLGLTYGDASQHFDYITLQDHVAPRTSSDLMFKAALDGASSEVWTGTVRIQKGAGGSEANQTSRNLLLSPEAKAAPIPVLEIEAYDIQRCSHGASAGPLDEEQRFYLEARGIPPAEAERLLVDAFFQQVIDLLPSDHIREHVERALAAKIGGV
ncbi:MAG TPA: Fe-S cluster assembly protein SufD [Dehalococcoidia bacterium]|nr:Fe-S cluster assembly protein SufD [Dehalococcoidia bacterium]